MSYPKAAKLTTDVVHILPAVQTIPPIQPEIFACNRFHLIRLTELEAKDLAETQRNFLEYLAPFQNVYELSMVAYKRVLHIALTSFSMKQLLFILSINATFNKYPDIFDNSSIISLFDEVVHEFNDQVEQAAICFSAMRAGFNPNNWTITNLEISKEEFEFIFEQFIHNYNYSIPIAYHCSYIALQLIISFNDIMKNIFIPISVILNEQFNKPPMLLIRMVNINRIRMGSILGLDSEMNRTVTIIRKEYNFWHQLPTNQNPSLYYMVMRQLESVLKLSRYSSTIVRSNIEQKMPINKRTNFILNDLTSFVLNLTKLYRKKNIQDFTTMFSFRSTDEVEQFYIEHVSTEVRLISYTIKPITAFATKFIILNEYSKERSQLLNVLLDMINEDFFIDNLKQKNLSNKDYKSILVKNNEKIHLRLVDLPLGKALKLNTKPSVTKVNYTSYHNKHCKQEGLGLFRRLWDSTTKFFENYDARKLKGPLSWDLLDSLSFDWRGRVTPRQPSSITTYNPMSYWPLIPKEEDMCNKAGKPYDIFIFQEVYENLLELDTTVNNPLLLP